MARVCPWWLGYFLISPLRRWISGAPEKILSPHVREGMTVLEPGPGMGFFTLALARLVGPGGGVIAIDVQPKMINALKRRAAKAGLADRIDARMANTDGLGIAGLAGKIDLTLAFAVVHEMPSATTFFQEVAAASKPGGALLFAEPAGHVSDALWNRELQAAIQAGFFLSARPPIRRSHAALLTRQPAGMP